MERWAGRVAIVTGASSGIGAAIARTLALSAMKVVGVARREERVKELAAELQKEGAKGEIFPVQGDVTNETDIKRVMQWTKEKLGGADVLVNNAGVAPSCVLHRFRTENIRKIYETNVIALALFTRDFVQDLRARGVDDGHIFHINSTAGQSIIHNRGIYPYSGSKHAVTVMTEGLRRELVELESKIRITSISPGLVRTEILEVTGLTPDIAKQTYDTLPCLETKDIADALVYALSTPPHVQIHEITIHPTGEDFRSLL
ncbi:farnesol dehydrogenase-like [Cloeon dipterum]|uniref:farnesol dehydrogenase-like n=1 Tax=Cloeon dipterum TaxID=197152 RepID=UPI0032203F2A